MVFDDLVSIFDECGMRLYGMTKRIVGKLGESWNHVMLTRGMHDLAGDSFFYILNFFF